MQLMNGDILTVLNQVDHLLVCTSSNVKDGRLLMTSGVAAKLAESNPDMDKAIGQWIVDNHGHDCPVYGVRAEGKVGLFQSMLLLRHGPNLSVVSFSAKQLKAIAEANPDKLYAVESPQGNDPWWLVKGIMETLPENVQVWIPNMP